MVIPLFPKRLYRTWVLLVLTKGNVVVTDSAGKAKVTLATTGVVVLPNADIAVTGVC